jgi:hypothetical protein
MVIFMNKLFIILMASLALTISAQSCEIINTANESNEVGGLDPQIRVFSLASSVQCSDFFDLDGPAVMHCQTTVGGQTIYVGIERAHEGNLKQLRKLKKVTIELANSDNGILRSSTLIWNQPNLKSRIMQVSGFTQTEFDNFKLLMTQYDEAYKLDKPLYDGRLPISQAAGGAETFLNYGRLYTDISCLIYDSNCIGYKHYFVYASNKPITGTFFFPEGFLEEDINLKKYMEYFKDLVMIMDFSKEPDNQDRFGGFFRNPISYILDGKKYEDTDLFIKLLAYTGAVTQGIGSMNIPDTAFIYPHYLMNVKGWQPGECIITKDSSERDILTYSEEGPYCLLFSKCQIKHSALAPRF